MPVAGMTMLLLCFLVPACERDPVSERDQATLNQIRLILNEIPGECTEDLVSGEGLCAPVEVAFERKSASVRSARQRILVIDHGMWEETLLTRASRILDLVEPDEHGILHTTTRKQTFSQGAVRIFHEAIGRQNPRLSFKLLREMSREIERKVLAPARGLQIAENDHGADILATLAELNPDAEFVIAQRKDVPNMDADPTRLRTYYDNYVGSLKKLIAEYGVTFINMSFGSPSRTPEGERIALEHFFTPLSSIPGVIVVQAGIQNVTRVLEADDAEFVSDCRKIRNRIRVGEVSWSKRDVAKNISMSQENARACVDVIVNKGPSVAEVRSDILSYVDELYCMSGIDAFACQYGTSYTAPLFLSYLLYLQQTQPALDTTEKLIARASKTGDIVDPGDQKAFLRRRERDNDN